MRSNYFRDEAPVPDSPRSQPAVSGIMPYVNLDDATESMARRITNTTFRTVRFSPGYDELEVDEFLDKAVDAIRGGRQVSESPRFSVTRLRPGYEMAQVDALVEEILRFTPPFR